MSDSEHAGVKGCPAFDVAAACAGFTYALSVADQYVKSGAVEMRW
jgi:3-oxoacyl-[acyl-carrier-protein] synthase-3